MRILEGTDVQLEVDGSSPIVCLPLTDVRQAPVHVLATIESVLMDSEPGTQIAIAGRDDDLDMVSRRSDHLPADSLLGLRLPAGSSEAQLLQTLLDACAPADVVLLSPGVLVHPQWLLRLRRAASSDSVVASASALFDADRVAAERIADASLALRPRIENPSPHCALLRRRALDLLCPISKTETYGDAIKSLGERLRALGMVHVAADDVAVKLAASVPRIGRHPTYALSDVDWLHAGGEEQELGPLPRALRRGSISLGALNVTIDARSLTAGGDGTRTYVLGLALALAKDSRVQLRALVAPDISPYAANVLSDAEIEMITPAQLKSGTCRDRTEIVHRPQQISSSEDFVVLKAAGERLVITHQDLIAYHNHSYHRDLATWERYREITRAALAAADRVVFFSEHARTDALAEDLLSPQRAHVVGIGTEQMEPAPVAGTPPAGVAVGDQFIFCLGADYAHKNRPFAIRLLQELRGLGWEGLLLLAGAHVPHGSSRPHEQALLAADACLQASVIDLGAIDEPTKRWLFEHARALVYPSISEGFGLLPLEAARMSLPCLYAPQASLAELDAGAATLLPWNAAASARAVLPLLTDGQPRARHLAALASLRVARWTDVVDQLVDVYTLAAIGRRSAGALLDPKRYLDLLAQLRDTQHELDYHRDLAQDYQNALHALEARVSVGLPLIDQSGALLSHAQQRGLMRVASRRAIGALALAPFQAIGSVGNARSDNPRHGDPEVP